MPMSSILNVMSNNKCKECGCSKWSTDHDVHLHVEIENLKQKITEKDNHIVTMETAFINEANKFPNGELIALKDELLTWQDKYKRLYEAHRRVQRVNQGLEDKLLKLVDVCESEKSALTKDVATLSHRLAEANYSIKKLTDENERYKNDVSIAIQLLQCKPSNFIPQKFESLPNEMQEKVTSYVTNKRRNNTDDKKTITMEARSIKVPIPTFPPTAMVYSINKSPSPEKNTANLIGDLGDKPQVDIVSAAIMARVLEERQRERSFTKHCDTCICSKSKSPRLIQPHVSHHTTSTQTASTVVSELLCTRCNAVPPPPTPFQDSVAVAASRHLVIGAADDGCQKAPLYPGSNGSSFEDTRRNGSGGGGGGRSSSALSSQQLQAVLYYNVNEHLENKSKHHRLCEKAVTATAAAAAKHHRDFKIDEKCDEEKPILFTNVEDQLSSDSTKGPRFCSVRLQNGSNNILLDNVQDTFAPILYTSRNHNRNKSATMTDSDIKRQQDSSVTESCSSEDPRKPLSLLGSQSSLHNQQRVAEWIQKSVEENGVNSSDNSESHNISAKKNVNDEALRYAEMEDNVKRFLFAGCDKLKLKTVPGERYKYQSLRDSDNNSVTRSTSSKSRTETEI